MTGCADPTSIGNAQLSRNGDIATITCLDNSDQTWKLRCNASSGEWIGKHHPCGEGQFHGLSKLANLIFKLDFIS